MSPCLQTVTQVSLRRSKQSYNISLDHLLRLPELLELLPGLGLGPDTGDEDHLLHLGEARVQQPGGEQAGDGVAVRIILLCDDMICLCVKILWHPDTCIVYLMLIHLCNSGVLCKLCVDQLIGESHERTSESQLG